MIGFTLKTLVKINQMFQYLKGKNENIGFDKYISNLILRIYREVSIDILT